jgi:hypothetical protein
MRLSRVEEFSAAQSRTEYRRSIVWQALSCGHVPDYAVPNLPCSLRSKRHRCTTFFQTAPARTVEHTPRCLAVSCRDALRSGRHRLCRAALRRHRPNREGSANQSTATGNAMLFRAVMEVRSGRHRFRRAAIWTGRVALRTNPSAPRQRGASFCAMLG